VAQTTKTKEIKEKHKKGSKPLSSSGDNMKANREVIAGLLPVTEQEGKREVEGNGAIIGHQNDDWSGRICAVNPRSTKRKRQRGIE